jgi:Gluconate 2-dehydrogenase subunit 3
MSAPLNLDRRATMAWMLAAASSPLALAGCSDPSGWRDMKPGAVNAAGYGGDPKLIDAHAPWPLTLTSEQRAIARAAADLIVPADEKSAGAGALGVDAFLDEWVSAPYEQQQSDRAQIVSGLAWLDAETQRRFSRSFAAASEEQGRAIFDDIAFRERVKPGYDKPAAFFARLRGLVVAAFYMRPEGLADLGYMGNSPIAGPYPGPSAEALSHLRGKLEALGLAMPD